MLHPISKNDEWKVQKRAVCSRKHQRGKSARRTAAKLPEKPCPLGRRWEEGGRPSSPYSASNTIITAYLVRERRRLSDNHKVLSVVRRVKKARPRENHPSSGAQLVQTVSCTAKVVITFLWTLAFRDVLPHWTHPPLSFPSTILIAIFPA